MAHRKVEEDIERLNLLRDAPAAQAVPALRKALADRVNLVVAKGAKLAAEMRYVELIPDLLTAFERLLEKPVERDPQCWGKNAVAKALKDLDCREPGPYLRGMRHIQMEPVWDGRQDTAPTLRGICLLALAACTGIRREELFRALVDALTEEAHTVRIEAVRALVQLEGDESALLLRLKARLGDRELPVMGQVFDALLRLEADRAIPFIADFLQSGQEGVIEEAALALGGSRRPAAIEALEEAWKGTRDSGLRLVLLRALSSSRQEKALGFLLDLVRNGRLRDAGDALDALALHRESREIRRQVEEAVTARGSDLDQQFHESFG
jgi:hypothetical protein